MGTDDRLVQAKLGLRDWGLSRSVRRGGVRRATLEDETPVAIAAVDKAGLVNLEIHARVAKGCTAGNFAGAVAGDARGGDDRNFGCGLHE